ncbi:MAG: T9SS type A sorting domain-containing protein [Rhodothermales bacterium]
MEAGSLASGLYLMRISQGREVIHHKVVKTN